MKEIESSVTFTLEKDGVKPYGDSYSEIDELDRVYRVISDHMRMVCICMADGIDITSSDGRGAIVRRYV